MRGFVIAIGLLLSAASASAQECDDPWLSEAAAATLLAHAGVSPSSTELSDAARIAGSNAVALRWLRATPGDAAALEAFSADARGREGDLYVCGEAESETAHVRIVGREGARVSAPLIGDGRAIDVILRPVTSGAKLVVRAAGGATFERALARPSTRVVLPDAFGSAFVAQVLATDASGPRPVAELVVGMPQEASADDATDEDAAIHVARLRRHASAPALRRNTILDRIALAHARVVCDEGRAVHSEGELDPVDRVRRAGLEARLVGEVVARAANRREALAALDASPSHRIALEDPRFTDVGVGELMADDSHTCTVVLLAAWPRFAGR